MTVEGRNLFLFRNQPPQTFVERTRLWSYDNPTAAKVILVAGLILGAGFIVLPFFVGSAVGAVITATFILTGIALALASAVALFAIDIIASPHHDMGNHVFKEGECMGGKLFYEGDVPILSLDGQDPFTAGKAHGYLCGDAINRITKRFNLVLHTLGRRPRAADLPETMQAVRETIPSRYLKELEGIVAGYNEWAKEQSWWNFTACLTVEDLILFHLIPDSIHFNAGRNEKRARSSLEQAFACSAVVNREEDKGLVLARNMDWPSFGIAGAYSLVINRKGAGNSYGTVEVGIPGFAGTLTGMNSKGLSLAMNVCAGETDNIQGMPACFYNRLCLTSCKTVEDVEWFIQERSPLGDYHMTVLDRNEALSIHFYQTANKRHNIRRWAGKPLTTLNWRYCSTTTADMHCSQEREEVIDKFFQKRRKEALEDVLALPFVNNWITTHKVVIQPRGKVFKVAFDNAFAGKAPLHDVPVEKLIP